MIIMIINIVTIIMISVIVMVITIITLTLTLDRAYIMDTIFQTRSINQLDYKLNTNKVVGGHHHHHHHQSQNSPVRQNSRWPSQ